MKKTLNHIFDEANANEIDNLVKQNAAPEVSSDTLSSIKDKVYAKTNLKKEKKPTKGAWLRFGAIAACFFLIISVIIAIPMLFEEDTPVFLPDNVPAGNEGYSAIVSPPDNGSVENEGSSTVLSPNNGVNGDSTVEVESALESYYDFEINSAPFTTYTSGRVIDTEKVGSKFETVTVTGGWKNAAGEWISTEALNAELYEIRGIDSGIAVALKFIDQPDAATTTFYYVMLNPNADLCEVEQYVRYPIVPNNPGDEMVNE